MVQWRGGCRTERPEVARTQKHARFGVAGECLLRDLRAADAVDVYRHREGGGGGGGAKVKCMTGAIGFHASEWRCAGVGSMR